MKRIFLLTGILFFAVLSTACVNNLAIQELNNKAQSYMEKGDNQSAICRLEASLDLDSNVFETRYNLGLAYLNAQQYDKAADMLQKAIELKPDFVDTYYSYAVAVDEFESIEIDKIKSPEKFVENNDKVVLTEESTIVEEKPSKLSDEAKSLITEKVNKITEAYNTYLEKNPNAQEKDAIEARLNSLQNMLNAQESF